MSKENKSTELPKLRFPEFHKAGHWIRESMGQVFDFLPNNSLSRDKLNYEHGTVKNIHYGDIHTKFKTLFKIDEEVVPFINKTESLEKYKPESYCREGDLIFADASEDLEDIGKSIELVSLNNEKILSGTHTILARPKENKFFIGFAGYLFKSNFIRDQIKSESQGAKVLGISAKKLAKIDLLFPEKKQEQQKIAECFSSLDELIAAQRKKIEALKDYKKGLLQQLFPQVGEEVPKLRFPEFKRSGVWIKKKIEDIAPLQRGFDLTSSDLQSGNIPVVYSNGIRNYHNIGKVTGPGLVTGRSGTIGNLHFIEKGDYWPHNTSLWVTTFNGNHPKFIYYLFTRIGIERFASGSGVPTLNRNDVHAFETYIPTSISEQQFIANCLSSLDSMITSQNESLELLKIHKKGLLQQLFPSSSEGNDE